MSQYSSTIAPLVVDAVLKVADLENNSVDLNDIKIIKKVELVLEVLPALIILPTDTLLFQCSLLPISPFLSPFSPMRQGHHRGHRAGGRRCV